MDAAADPPVGTLRSYEHSSVSYGFLCLCIIVLIAVRHSSFSVFIVCYTYGKLYLSLFDSVVLDLVFSMPVYVDCIIEHLQNNSLYQHTHTFNGPLSRGTTRMSQYQKGKTNLDFTKARDSEWQWHQLGHMQVCTSLHTGNHATTPPLSFLLAGYPSCHPTNRVKALKA